MRPRPGPPCSLPRDRGEWAESWVAVLLAAGRSQPDGCEGIMTSTTTAMSLAWQHFQAGNLDEAEVLYRQVLAAEPERTDALCLLAMVYQVQGRLAESITLYQQCLRINPDFAEAHNNLG